MMNADPRIALVANRTVAARQQQRRTLHRDRHDIVDAQFSPARNLKQASITA